VSLFDGARPDPGSRAAMDALARHPHFAEAVRIAAAGALARYSGQRIANRVLNDRGRLVFSFLLLDLAFRAEAGGEPATAARLRAALSSAGIASPNRVSAMLAALRVFGLVTVGPGRDRRSRSLIPTEALVEETRLRWQALTASTALLFPELGPTADALADRRVMAAAVHAVADLFRGGYRAATVVPAIEPFVDRDGGLIILLALLFDEGFTIAGTARRFHLSRAHVAKVVDAAAAYGLARRDGPRGSEIGPTPTLSAAIDNFFASGLLAYALALDAAAAVASAPPQRSAASASASAAASSGAPAATPDR
jgi:hypothetical protein